MGRVNLLRRKERWKDFKYTLWVMTPALLTWVGMFLFAIPMPLPGFHDATPLVAIIAIFYWCCYAPEALPTWFVFLTGLVQDVLLGTPIGLSATYFLLLYMAVTTQRKFFVRESFTGLWIVFTIISGFMMVAYWLALEFLHDQSLPFTPFSLQWLLTFLLYPALHALFSIVYTFSPVHSDYAH